MRLTAASQTTCRYFYYRTQTLQSFGHGGFYPGYNSQVVYFPKSGVAIALQINSDKSEIGDHTMALARLVLDGLEEETSDDH